MYLSLLKNKRKTNLNNSKIGPDHFTTSVANPFDEEEIKHLAQALRQNHLNRLWDIFQEYELNLDLCSDLTKDRSGLSSTK